jgi:hypothetical protein
MNKGLIALGLAAFAYYRYNKMTAEEKAKMKDQLKKAGKKISDHSPADLKETVDRYKNRAEKFA